MANFHEDFAAYLDGKDDRITQSVISDDKGDSIIRMNIYKDAYQLRLIDILYTDFPTIYEILGTESFMEMAADYLKRYPSTSFTVRHFGQHFAKYLSETSPYSDYPYLWQIADFEWAKGTVFDAPETQLVTLNDFVKMPPEAWETAVFKFIPAMTRLIYDYNVPQIWHTINQDNQNSEPTELAEPIPWVMWRKDLNPNWYSMPADEDWFFIQARQGKNFTDLCEGLSKWIDDEDKIAIRAAEILRRWINEKMLMHIEY